MIRERAARWRPGKDTRMIQAITIEREFGCGGSEIAAKLAALLGWKLWDQELTQEIARLTNCTPQAVAKREWKNDPAVYRVFKSFLRGAFEGGLPPTDRLEPLDARRIARVSELAVNRALSGGPCVIVGRGSQYFLRDRKDVFRAFLYASRTSKIQRLIAAGSSEGQAINDVDTIDRNRAAFVKRYLKLNWPEHNLYDAMLNTERGDAYIAEVLAHCVQQIASREQVSQIPISG
jgi:cytidylate kinase